MSDVPKLTKEQAAIIGAYTGFTCGPMSDVHEYVETLPGFAGIGPLGLAMMGDNGAIREAAKADFLALCYGD